MAKAKQRAYEDLDTTKERWVNLYRLAKQTGGDGKDVQQVSVIKDKDGNVLTGASRVN